MLDTETLLDTLKSMLWASPVLCNLDFVLSKHVNVSMSKYVEFNIRYVNVYYVYSFFSLKWTDFNLFMLLWPC